LTLLYEAERRRVARAALGMLQSGLVANTSGNASLSVGEHVLITPSSRPYDALEAADIVVLDRDGNTVDGKLLPSSETPLHLSVYAAEPGVNAIVHTHSVYATAVTTVSDELPAIHYQVADLGGPVPVAPYRTFGTPELAEVVTAALRGRSAVLMKNHGAVTVGRDLDQALARAVSLEWLAEVYLIAAQSGTPSLIDAAELKRTGQRLEDFAARQRARLEDG